LDKNSTNEENIMTITTMI